MITKCIFCYFFYISGKVSELQKLTGNYVVKDEHFERLTKKSVEDCESECLNDEKCQAMYYSIGFCFIVYKDVPPIPYSGVALYYKKILRHGKYLKMYLVTTRVNKSMCFKFWHSQCIYDCVEKSLIL